MTGEQRGFPGRAFIAFAVGEQTGDARVGRAQVLVAVGHARRDRQAVTERAGRGGNGRDPARRRMCGQERVVLVVRGKLGVGQLSEVMQRRVQGRRAVTLAQDELIVRAQPNRVQVGQEIDRRQAATDVTRARFVVHAQEFAANGQRSARERDGLDGLAHRFSSSTVLARPSATKAGLSSIQRALAAKPSRSEVALRQSIAEAAFEASANQAG